jgi:hypothetical protein
MDLTPGVEDSDHVVDVLAAKVGPRLRRWGRRIFWPKKINIVIAQLNII